MPVVLAEAVPGMRIEVWETTKAESFAAEAAFAFEHACN